MGKERKLVLSYIDMLDGNWDFPGGKVAKIIFDASGLGFHLKMGKAVGEALGKMGGLTEDDTENVRRIVEAGRKEGVKEMDIEMDREQWVGLKAKGNIDRVGAEVGFGTGGSTGYRVRVKYK